MSEANNNHIDKFPQLRDYAGKVADIHIQGCILTIEHVAEAFKAPFLIAATIHCVAHIAGFLAPSLSVSLIDGNTVFYNNLRSLTDTLKLHRCFPLDNYDEIEYYQHNTENYSIFVNFPTYYHYTDIDKRTVCLLIGKICETVRKSSLQLENLERDALVAKYDVLKAELKQKPDFSLLDLCQFIRDKEGVSVISIYVDDIDYALIYEPNEFNRNKDKLPDCILDTGSSTYKERIRYLFVEAVGTGKALSGLIASNNSSIAFVLIPVIRKAESPARITNVILMYSDTPLYAKTVALVIDYVDIYVTYMMSERKLKNILALQEEVLNIPVLLVKHKINNYAEFEDIFLKFLRPYLHEILRSTYAYSAVVRLYDCDNKTLSIFEEVSNLYGERDKEREQKIYRSIPLKQNSRTSVNAFTFLDGGKRHDYVYIRNLKATIPGEYRKSGLDSVLLLRSRSLSEICFALLAGYIPFGVLNIESQVKGAFDEDIEYLFAIKEGIESFHNNLLNANDIQWIRSQLDKYESIHEVKNYASVGFFDDSARKILEHLLWPPAEELKVAKVKYGEKARSIEPRMNRWINEMYSIFDKSNKENLQKILKYHLDKDIILPPDLIENILIILRNLIQNVVRYGDQLRDSVIVSTRPFYGIGDESVIRIHMRTYGRFTDDVLSKIGIAPITDYAGDPHFGMFLIGMLTRILGGTMHVSRDVLAPFHIIELRIPISRR